METPAPANGQEHPGTTDPSSDRFDRATAGIPDSIGGNGDQATTPEPEIIPPGQQAPPETGWPTYDLQLIGSVMFWIAARRYGDLWELDDRESTALAKAWKPVLDKYLPLENTMWGTAALLTLAIVGPRAMQTDWSKGKKKPATAANPSPSPAPASPTQQANTRTAAAGESKSISANGNQGNLQDWEMIFGGYNVSS